MGIRTTAVGQMPGAHTPYGLFEIAPNIHPTTASAMVTGGRFKTHCRAHTTVSFPVVQFNAVKKQFVATRKVPEAVVAS